jgi:hypothetical protein
MPLDLSQVNRLNWHSLEGSLSASGSETVDFPFPSRSYAMGPGSAEKFAEVIPVPVSSGR